MSDMLATSITGSFIALNFFLHLLGGYIGGRFLSYRSLFCAGMVLQTLGCLIFSKPGIAFFFWGLATFLGGTGLNMTCINCMITQLFTPEDKRRETIFLWNYSGMNAGFLVGFLVSGYFHLLQEYQSLFMLSAFGNLIALCIILYNWKILKDRDTLFLNSTSAEKRMIGFTSVIVLVFVLRALLDQTTLCNMLILILGVLMFVLLGGFTLQEPSQSERNKIWAFIVLSIASLFFWALYQLAPMGLNLFIERNVDRHYLGLLIAPQWVQAINTVIIILGGPILSMVFFRMRQRGINLNIPLQFSLALVLIGIAYLLLPIGIHFADAQGFTNFNWILATYLLQSVGELFISPIGYAMVGQLAPVRLRGLMMGMWMMLTGVAAILSDHFSKLALGTSESINPLLTNASFSHTFAVLGFSAMIAGILLYFLVPAISHLST